MKSSAHLILRDLHNLTRWAIVIAGLYALVVNYRGWLGSVPWTVAARRSGLYFSTALHVQLIVAIGLYLTSPLIETAWQDLGLAMGDSNQRFFSIEHPVQMFLAIIAATVGYSLSKRASSDRRRFGTAAIAYTLAAILIGLAVPWPFSLHPRPLLPKAEWWERKAGQ